MKRDQKIESLEVVKYADFLELSSDVTAIKPTEIINKVKVKVKGTSLDGKKIDTAQFLKEVSVIDPGEHQGLADAFLKSMHIH